MGLEKCKPFRSKEFMKFLHRHRKNELCARCMVRPWTQLHHFGYDGGKALKPSDLFVVRLCKKCADENEIKARALALAGKWEVLACFLQDAMLNVDAWLKYRRDRGRLTEEDQETMAHINTGDFF